MSVRVVLSTGVSDDQTGGVKEFDIEAKDVRAVIRELDERFPGLGEVLREETMVAIDGELFESALFQPLPDGSEVYFLPKLEAG